MAVYGRGIIAAAHAVEKLTCGFGIALAQFAFGKRVYDFGQTNLGKIAFSGSRIIVAVHGMLHGVPSGIIVAGNHVAFGRFKPFVFFHIVELTHGVADTQVVRHFRCFQFTRNAVLLIFEIAVEEHTLTLSASEILVFFQTHVAGVFTEFLHRHAQLEIVKLAGGIIARRAHEFAVMTAMFHFGVVEEQLRVGRYAPVVQLIVVPAGVVARTGEEVYQFVALVILRIERSVPAVVDLIGTVNTVDNVLCHFFAIGQTVDTYIFFRIQI